MGQKQTKEFIDKLSDWLKAKTGGSPTAHWGANPEANTPENVVADTNWFLEFEDYANEKISKNTPNLDAPDLVCDGHSVIAAFPITPAALVVFFCRRKGQASNIRIYKEVLPALEVLEKHACKMSGPNPEAYLNLAGHLDAPVHSACLGGTQ